MPVNPVSPSPLPGQTQPPRPTQPPSFAALARRISGWTTNLLATGIIAVLALVVGKQLVVWWQVEPGGSTGRPAASTALPAAVPLTDLGGGGPIELGFGRTPYQIQCRTARGDIQAAIDALAAACRELAAESPAIFPDFGSAEAGLLKLTAGSAPIARGPGNIEVFASPTGLPLVVVTSLATGNPDAKSGGSGLSTVPAAPAPAGPQLGAGRRRVLIWGLAAAAAEGEWNLYVAHASRSSGKTTSLRDAVSQDTVPIPPGSQRSLAMWDVHGGGLSAFAGNGRAEDWLAFYSAWFGQGSWIVSQPWRPAGGCWHARYERAGSSGRETVDVQFGPAGRFGSDAAAGLVGLISIAGAEPPGGK